MFRPWAVKSHVKRAFDKFQTCDVARPIRCAKIVENCGGLLRLWWWGLGNALFGIHGGLFLSQGGHLNCPPWLAVGLIQSPWLYCNLTLGPCSKGKWNQRTKWGSYRVGCNLEIKVHGCYLVCFSVLQLLPIIYKRSNRCCISKKYAQAPSNLGLRIGRLLIQWWVIGIVCLLVPWLNA